MSFPESFRISTLLVILTFCAFVRDSSALSMIDERSESNISQLSANKINSPSMINQQDAPNYYDKNAQLYKKTRSKFDESDSGAVSSKENSSIDSLIKSMRPGSTQDDVMSVRPSHEDEATIQRKSTSDETGSAKLRRGK